MFDTATRCCSSFALCFAGSTTSYADSDLSEGHVSASEHKGYPAGLESPSDRCSTIVLLGGYLVTRAVHALYVGSLGGINAFALHLFSLRSSTLISRLGFDESRGQDVLLCND